MWRPASWQQHMTGGRHRLSRPTRGERRRRVAAMVRAGRAAIRAAPGHHALKLRCAWRSDPRQPARQRRLHTKPTAAPGHFRWPVGCLDAIPLRGLPPLDEADCRDRRRQNQASAMETPGVTISNRKERFTNSLCFIPPNPVGTDQETARATCRPIPSGGYVSCEQPELGSFLRV